MRVLAALPLLAACAEYHPAELCGTHDEDGDGIADGCDNCPGFANPDQRNDDEDNLGDDCDPARSLPNTVVLFESFADLAKWAPRTGGWEQADDAAVFTPAAFDDTQNHTLAFGPVFSAASTMVLEYGVTIAANYRGNASIAIAVGNTGPIEGLTCGISRVVESDRIEIRQPQTTNTLVLDKPVVAGDRYRIVMGIEGAALTCIVVDQLGTTTVVDATRLGPMPPGGLSLIASEVGVSVEYVAVYGNL